MTAEAYTEYLYRYNERLGILCGSSEPTPEQIEMAKKQAEEDVKEIGL